MSRGDRYFNLTLRILTLAVMATLMGCVVWLMHRWIQPAQADTSYIEAVQAPQPPVAAPLPVQAPPVAIAQVLQAPGLIFKCERNGRISYSDQPCRDQ